MRKFFNPSALDMGKDTEQIQKRDIMNAVSTYKQADANFPFKSWNE